VVEVDEISRELCGGTHVGRTGEIGLLVLLGESGIGANIRRIEAVTGMEAYDYFRQRREMVEGMAASLKVEPGRLPERLDRMAHRVKELESEIKKRGREEMASLAEGGISWAENDASGGEKIVTAVVEDMDPQSLRELAERTLAARKAGVVGIASIYGGKANMVLHVSKELVAGGLDAVEVVRKAGRLLGGGGGGRADMAVGGGSDTAHLEEALEAVVNEVLSKLERGDA